MGAVSSGRGPHLLRAAATLRGQHPLRAAEAKAGDAYLLEALMNTNKRFYYTYLRSNLVNGLTSEVGVSTAEPWWKIALWVCDGVLAAAAVAGIGAYLYLVCTKKDKLTAGGKR